MGLHDSGYELDVLAEGFDASGVLLNISHLSACGLRMVQGPEVWWLVYLASLPMASSGLLASNIGCIILLLAFVNLQVMV